MNLNDCSLKVELISMKNIYCKSVVQPLLGLSGMAFISRRFHLRLRILKPVGLPKNNKFEDMV